MTTMLELFSGAGSVGKVAEQMGMTVISLDRDMEADLQCDIMDWDYRELPRHMFDIVWANPPYVGLDLERSNKIVKRTLDIIEYFKPKNWIIGNPYKGLLKDQPFIHGIPYNDLDHCKYGMPYRKRTRLWNNVDHWQPKPLCAKDCDSMNLTRTRHISIPGVKVFPESLIREILDCCDMFAPNGSEPSEDGNMMD
jgi:hypothetical protein